MAGKILVPVDFSNHTLVSCHYALSLAKMLRKDIILFHSFYDQIYFSDGGFSTGFESGIMLTDEIILDFYKQKEAKLQEMTFDLTKAAAGSDHFNIDISYKIESGDPEVMILNAILRIDPDLIIMGSSGIGKKSIFSGSVARRIMDNTTIPVIAVPNQADLPGISSVAYMTSFDPYDPLVISEMDSLLAPLFIHIHVLHFCSAKNEKEACAEMDKLTHKELVIRPETSLSYHVITGNDPQEPLEAYLLENHVNLIAFIPHKRNIFKNFNRQNLSKDDLFMTRIPILGIPSRS